MMLFPSHQALFSTLLLSLGAFTTTAAPTAAADTAESGINTTVVRAPIEHHKANIYNNVNCQGANYFQTVSEFKCGGCQSLSQDALSVYLEYSGSGPKPTAECFESWNCSGKSIQHIGIWNGYTTGCTNMPRQVHSCNFYYNCQVRELEVAAEVPTVEEGQLVGLWVVSSSQS